LKPGAAFPFSKLPLPNLKNIRPTRCIIYVIDGKSLKLKFEFCPSITQVNGVEERIIFKILFAVYISAVFHKIFEIPLGLVLQ